MSELAIVVTGFFVGALTSYSGVGAGSLMTPALILMLGVRSDVAIGSDLLYALVTKLFALVAHARVQVIDRALLWILGPSGVLGAVVGLALTAFLHLRIPQGQLDHVLRDMLGATLLLAAAAIGFSRVAREEERPGAQPRLPVIRLALSGAFVGFMVSLTSIGAGSLTLPLLLLVLPNTPLRRLVGTDIAFAVILLVPSLIGHVGIGDVNAKLAGLLLLGSVPGVFVGASFVRRFSERIFRVGLTVVLIAVGVSMFR